MGAQTALAAVHCSASNAPFQGPTGMKAVISDHNEQIHAL